MDFERILAFSSVLDALLQSSLLALSKVLTGSGLSIIGYRKRKGSIF